MSTTSNSNTRKKKEKEKKEIYKERKDKEKRLVTHTIRILPFFGTYDTPTHHFNRITISTCQLKIASIFVFWGDTILSCYIHL